MNKFKHLQLIGTLLVLSPAVLAIGGAVVFTFNTPEEAVSDTLTVEVLTPKVDTVIVVKEVAPVAPTPPVVKKPTPPPAPAPEPPKVVKDTVIEKITAELDTTK